MTRRFLGALQFLTVLPIGGKTSTTGEAAVFFPLVGAMLGASAGAVSLLFSLGLDQSISAFLAIAWLLFLTGCLHEDGLADVADALRAGRTRELMMQILKDSRIGTYGAAALIVSIAVRSLSIAQINNPVPGLAAALSLSRTSLVVVAALSPSVGEGIGQAFITACSRPVLALAATQAIAITCCTALYIGWQRAAAMILATALVALSARAYFLRRLGGANGDCLGATCQTVEIILLLILAWHPSI